MAAPPPREIGRDAAGALTGDLPPPRPRRAAESAVHADAPTWKGGASLLARLRAPEGGVSAQAVYAGLVVLGFANGVAEKAATAIARDGFVGAFLATFDVSVILWGAALAAVLKLIGLAPSRPVVRGDLANAAAVALLCLAPVPALGWVGLAALGLYLLATSRPASAERRAAILVVLLTVPLFWARILFATFSDAILRMDAVLVGLAIGSTPLGNVVPFADGSGSMFVGPSCSSLANVSLAMLCAAASVAYLELRWTPRRLAWAAATCAAVILINVTRIGLIGLYPERFELIHGPMGAACAGWITVAAIVTMTLQGTVGDAP